MKNFALITYLSLLLALPAQAKPGEISNLIKKAESELQTSDQTTTRTTASTVNIPNTTLYERAKHTHWDFDLGIEDFQAKGTATPERLRPYPLNSLPSSTMILPKLTYNFRGFHLGEFTLRTTVFLQVGYTSQQVTLLTRTEEQLAGTRLHTLISELGPGLSLFWLRTPTLSYSLQTGFGHIQHRQTGESDAQFTQSRPYHSINQSLHWNFTEHWRSSISWAKRLARGNNSNLFLTEDNFNISFGWSGRER